MLNSITCWVSVDVRLLAALLVPRIPDPCANLEKTESAFLGGESRKCDKARREPCVSSCQTEKNFFNFRDSCETKTKQVNSR